MDRFRRSSKSSIKSLESPKKSSPPTQPPQPKEWPQHEEELFKEIKNYIKFDEKLTGSGKAESNRFIDDDKRVFGKNVDTAEEAYKTPSKSDAKDSKIPRFRPHSDEKGDETKGDSKEGDDQDKTGANGPEEEQDGKTMDGKQQEEKVENKTDVTEKMEEKIDTEGTVGMIVNTVIGCIAFVMAATLVTYCLLKDLVPSTLSNLRKAWDRATATLFVTPTFFNMIYEEVFEPLMKQPELFKKIKIKAPPIVVTKAE